MHFYFVILWAKTNKFSQALATQRNSQQRMQRENVTNRTSVMEANQNTTSINGEKKQKN
jgi:hypothetical protein